VDLAGRDDPAAELERARIRSAVETCFERIPNADHQRALALFLLEDRSYAEITEAVRVPLNTAKAWIRRARIALRQCLVEVFGIGEADAERNPAGGEGGHESGARRREGGSPP
jgi:RNA polymerase sigma-70 factor (ECF subfamily)